jgi:hypothetical protein
VIIGAASAVIVLGILRGTVFGQIKTLDALTTTYGLTWLVALVLALFTFYWGYRVIGAALARFEAFRSRPGRAARRVGQPGHGRPDHGHQAEEPVRAPPVPRDLHLHDPHALRVLTGPSRHDGAEIAPS